MNIKCSVAVYLWVLFLVYEDCHSLPTESAEVEAISSLVVCCVCMFGCAFLGVEGQGKERQTPSHSSIWTWQREREGDEAERTSCIDNIRKIELGRERKKETVETINNWVSIELMLLLRTAIRRDTPQTRPNTLSTVTQIQSSDLSVWAYILLFSPPPLLLVHQKKRLLKTAKYFVRSSKHSAGTNREPHSH